MNPCIIGIRENPNYVEQAIKYFTDCWGIDERIYRDCIIHSLTARSSLPRFYLMLEGARIIGGYGLVTNDFVSRQDLFPYLCALYIEEDMRGKELGSVLLEHGRKESKKLGLISCIYVRNTRDIMKSMTGRKSVKAITLGIKLVKSMKQIHSSERMP